MLKKIFENNHYIFENNFNTWQEAIRSGYKPLLDDGIVSDDYIQHVIECVEEYGPYIVLIPGVAMPHSSIGCDGCFGNAISLMIVREDVVFDQDDSLKNARLFFSLASISPDEHMNNITQLMELLCDEEIMEALFSVCDESDLKSLIYK